MMMTLIDYFGTKAKMARTLKVSRGVVTFWGTRGIPAHKAIMIEKITGGKFKASDIVGKKLGVEV
jgi:DNA-binding transcriptional regulator YdaS (Cro superfamily)